MRIENLVNVGDLFKYNTGELGIILQINNKLTFCSSIKSNPINIVEIRRPYDDFGIVNLNSWENSEVIWKNNSIFVGISYRANSDKIKKFKEVLNSPYTEYAENMSQTYNYQKLCEADRYIMIPPDSFQYDHIIGEGLYQQYLQRKKSGKTSEIFVDNKIVPIRKIYKLNSNDYIKSALVIF